MCPRAPAAAMGCTEAADEPNRDPVGGVIGVPGLNSHLNRPLSSSLSKSASQDGLHVLKNLGGVRALCHVLGTSGEVLT